MELMPTFPTPGHKSQGIFIGDGLLTTLGAYFSIQSNISNTDTEGAIQNVCINWVKFGENVGAFFSQEQSKLFVIVRCLYLFGVYWV